MEKKILDEEIQVYDEGAIPILLRAVAYGHSLIRDGHYIVNKIGAATYVDVFRLTAKELQAIIDYVKKS